MIMTVLQISPGHKPEKITIDRTLEAMQVLVGGYIQAIYPYEDLVALVCNEEGKLQGLEPNRAVRDIATNEIVDIICGTFFICGLSEDDFCSLTDEQIAYYTELYLHPEMFLWTGDRLTVLSVDADG